MGTAQVQAQQRFLFLRLGCFPYINAPWVATILRLISKVLRKLILTILPVSSLLSGSREFSEVLTPPSSLTLSSLLPGFYLSLSTKAVLNKVFRDFHGSNPKGQL